MARLRHVRFFSLADLNAAIGMLLEDRQQPSDAPAWKDGFGGQSVPGRARILKPSSVDEWLPRSTRRVFVRGVIEGLDLPATWFRTIEAIWIAHPDHAAVDLESGV